jgi:hypothetical protein
VLRDVLARHPAACDFPEARFLVDPDGLLDAWLALRDTWTPYRYDRVVGRLLAQLRRLATGPTPALLSRLLNRPALTRLTGRKMERSYLGYRLLDVCPTFLDRVDELEASLVDFDYEGGWIGMPAGAPMRLRYHDAWEPAELAAVLGGFWAGVARDACVNAGRDQFVQKETWSPLWFDVVLELAPAARLVHIVRDPRDVVASFRVQRWAPSDPVLGARFFAGLMNRWWEVRSRLPAGTLLELRLEDLVAHPRAELERLCDHIRLPFHETLLAHDLGRAHAGRWRRDLPAQSHAAVEELLSPAIEAYGYQ